CRPGLPVFLARTKGLYEMHIYTMGTRAYALEVCKSPDPDGSVFGGRVLTRDESGSMTAKNLQRLFPSDQSMVVVIDHRSDVWSDDPNVVKVIPCMWNAKKILRDFALISNLEDFLLGIGDINSVHLPKPPGPTAPPSSVATGSVAPRSHPPSSSSPSSTPAPLFGLTPFLPRLRSDVN
ncbi:hypothetical protein BS47DRAFT_1301157, partial [Hydnum rufescens UP504]